MFAGLSQAVTVVEEAAHFRALGWERRDSRFAIRLHAKKRVPKDAAFGKRLGELGLRWPFVLRGPCVYETACSQHVCTAVRKASEVRVAPDTVSTAGVCCSMTAGMSVFSMAA